MRVNEEEVVKLYRQVLEARRDGINLTGIYLSDENWKKLGPDIASQRRAKVGDCHIGLIEVLPPENVRDQRTHSTWSFGNNDDWAFVERWYRDHTKRAGR